MAVYQGLELALVSQDAVANSSRVRIVWQSTQTGASYNDYLRTGKVTVRVGGESTEYSVDYRLSKNATVTVADMTLTVPHTPDGQGHIWVQTWMDTGISAGEVTLQKELTLPVIPRATTPAAADTPIGSAAKILLSRKSDAYTHTLSYTFGALTGWLSPDGIRDTPCRFSATELTFPIGEEFYAQIPDAPRGSCTLTCTTYLDDTPIGTPQQAQFSVYADPNLCAPVLAAQLEDVNPVTAALTGDASVMVRYASTACCTAQAQAQKGAHLVALTIDGEEENPRTYARYDGRAVLVTATDSRGFVTQRTLQSGIVPYILLTVNASARRTDPTSGNCMLSVRGNFYSGSFGGAENTLRLTCRVDGGEEILLEAELDGDSYSAVALLSGLDYLQSHTVAVTAEDLADARTGTAAVGKGIPVFDWGESDFVFHVPVRLIPPTDADHAATKAYADTKADSAHTHDHADLSGTLAQTALPIVPVEKGGTGADNAAAARQNLGLGLRQLYSGSLSSGSAEFESDQGLLLVVGRTMSSNSLVSVLVPGENDGSKYQLYADGHWLTFTVTPRSLTVTSASSTGAITAIYALA